MAEFVKYSIAFVIIAIFSISLITFAVNFGTDNNAGINIGSDEGFNQVSSELKSNLSEFYTGTGTASEAYSKSTIGSQTESTEGGTQFKVTPATSLSMAVSTITTSWNRIFGKDSAFAFILTSLIAVFSFIMIMYAYKAWAGRAP
jgi:hypothetical protein